MNVIKYRASGTIQISGIEMMSVVTSVVIPSMRLDGTAASRSQRSWVVQCGGGSSAVVAGRRTPGAGCRAGGAKTTARPQAKIRNARPTNPTAQSQAWLTSFRLGSTTNGYATRASRLPKLLAAYRKYGSRAAE